MQVMQEIGDALSSARIEVRSSRLIGSGHMNPRLPMQDIAVLTWPRCLPATVPGFKQRDNEGRWWESVSGANIRLMTSPAEFESWGRAADAVRALFLKGVILDKEQRIAVYRAILD